MNLKLNDFKRPGLYKIVNLITNDCYIGSSWNCYERIFKHMSQLRRGRHKNYILQDDINKYGIYNFEFVTLRLFDPEELSRDTLYREEERYINIFNGKYNINRKTGKHFDLPQSSRERIAEAASKIYEFVSPSGEHITIKNLAKFCRENEFTPSGMAAVHSEKSLSYKGWTKYFVDGQQSINPKRAGVGKRIDRGKDYILTSPTGKVFKINNLNKFCETNNLSTIGFEHCSLGLQETCSGWKCVKADGSTPRYIRKSRGYYQITTPDNQIIIIDSIKKYCLKNNLNRTMMHNVAIGKAESHRGYKCIYLGKEFKEEYSNKLYTV